MIVGLNTEQGSIDLDLQPFDALAENYDAAFTTTHLGQWLRRSVWKRLDDCLSGTERILEIGCGTGEDAVYLATRGHSVLATDVSEPMIKVAKEKALQAGCADRIEFRCIAMERLAQQLDPESFGATFSNFGVINCAARLDTLIRDVSVLIKPGGTLIWVVMGRHVPWEWAWFLSRGDGRKAFRRLRKNGTTWRGMVINYPTPRSLARRLRPHFQLRRRSALGFVLPPSYAAGWLERSPRLFDFLSTMEQAAQKYEALASLSDHYVLEARRKPTITND